MAEMPFPPFFKCSKKMSWPKVRFRLGTLCKNLRLISYKKKR